MTQPPMRQPPTCIFNFCEEEDELIQVFTKQTLANCKEKLHIRKTCNLRFSDNEFPEKVNYSKGYHARCYKLFNKLSKKMKEDFKKITSSALEPNSDQLETAESVPGEASGTTEETLKIADEDSLNEPSTSSGIRRKKRQPKNVQVDEVDDEYTGLDEEELANKKPQIEEPPFISKLMNCETEHDCYFRIGNPVREFSERIGVVSSMLKAHSLVLRKLINDQETLEVKKRDFFLPLISPTTFKNILRFCYGFNNISTLSIPEAVDLMNASLKLVMETLFEAVEKHLISHLSPENICLMLKDAFLINETKFKQEIINVLCKHTEAILESNQIHLINPTNMRFIFLLESLKLSKIALWRVVVRWARTKVLEGEAELERLNISLPIKKAYFRPILIVPSITHAEECALNLIQFVRLALYRESSAKDAKNFISKYHMVPSEPHRTTLVCAMSQGKDKPKHEEYYVKIIDNTKLWSNPEFVENSDLLVTTSERAVQLVSAVCTAGFRYHPIYRGMTLESIHKDVSTYNVNCTIKIFHVRSGKKRNWYDLKATIYFRKDVLYNEEFPIPLHNHKSVFFRMMPNNTYKIETRFTFPHPLWFSHSCDSPDHIDTTDFEVKPGVVNPHKQFRGSHITYLLYRSA